MDTKVVSLLPFLKVEVTLEAKRKLSRQDISEALIRHFNGDAGDFNLSGKPVHLAALLNECRVLSAYRGQQGQRFWVISEPGASITRVLLPEDF